MYIKKSLLVILVIFLSMSLIIGCSNTDESLTKENNDQIDEKDDYINPEGVVIKGNFANNSINSSLNTTKAESNTISEVVVIYNNDYEMIDVENNKKTPDYNSLAEEINISFIRNRI